LWLQLEIFYAWTGPVHKTVRALNTNTCHVPAQQSAEINVLRTLTYKTTTFKFHTCGNTTNPLTDTTQTPTIGYTVTTNYYN